MERVWHERFFNLKWASNWLVRQEPGAKVSVVGKAWICLGVRLS